jgi:hypothetical protein
VVRKILSFCQRGILMAIWSKLSKLFKANKFLSYCYTPKVLEPGEFRQTLLCEASFCPV